MGLSTGFVLSRAAQVLPSTRNGGKVTGTGERLGGCYVGTAPGGGLGRSMYSEKLFKT